MRVRIKTGIITVKPTGVVLYNETKEQIELGKRRAQFERNRRKLKAIMLEKTLDPKLIAYSNGIANAIAEFKQSKGKNL